MFRALTEQAAVGPPIRRPLSFDLLAAVTGCDKDKVTQVVERFRRHDTAFLMPPADTALDDNPEIDISHESLIRGWKKLAEWVAKEARSADVYFRLKDSAIREKAKRAALCCQPELGEALTWLEQEAPTAAWATRYGTAEDFDLAMRFLERSKAKELADSEAIVQARRDKEELESQRRVEREKRLEAEARSAREMEAVERQRREDQEHAAKRAQRLSLFMIFGFVMALFAAGFAWRFEQEAKSQSERAQQAQRQETLARLSREANYQGDRAVDVSLLLALKLADNAGSPYGKQALLESIRLKPSVTGILHLDGSVDSMAFSRDGRILASGDSNGNLILWDAERMTQIARFEGHRGDIASLAFNPDGTLLASGDERGEIFLWDVAQRKRRVTVSIQAHTDNVTALVFSPNGLTLASAGYDGKIILWNLANLAEQQPLATTLSANPNELLTALAFSLDGKILAVGRTDTDAGNFKSEVGLWDVAQRRQRGNKLSLASDLVSALRFSPDKSTLVASDTAGNIAAWNLASGKKINEIRGKGTSRSWILFFPRKGIGLLRLGRTGMASEWLLLAGKRSEGSKSECAKH